MRVCLFRSLPAQVSTWFANARRRLKKENKVTWSPRACKSSDDRGCEDDSDDAEKEASKDKDTPGEQPLLHASVSRSACLLSSASALLSLSLQTSSAQSCRATSRTSTCLSQTLQTVNRGRRFFLRTVARVKSRSSRTATPRNLSTGKTGCRQSVPNSHPSTSRTRPSTPTQAFKAQKPSPKSGPSLTLPHLWRAPCRPSTPPACCLPLAPPPLPTPPPCP